MLSVLYTVYSMFAEKKNVWMPPKPTRKDLLPPASENQTALNKGDPKSDREEIDNVTKPRYLKFIFPVFKRS